MQDFKVTKFRNTYKITGIELTSTPMMVPFGLEVYKDKLMINAEFTNLNADNNAYNFYATIQQIDAFMNKLSYDEETINSVKNKSWQFNSLVQDISRKVYTSCIKTRPKHFDPLFRLHINKKLKLDVDLKSKAFVFKISVASVWISSTSYGLVWTVDEIK
jgi:hypothetical protein